MPLYYSDLARQQSASTSAFERYGYDLEGGAEADVPRVKGHPVGPLMRTLPSWFPQNRHLYGPGLQVRRRLLRGALPSPPNPSHHTSLAHVLVSADEYVCSTTNPNLREASLGVASSTGCSPS
jgi:hypothetical protein